MTTFFFTDNQNLWRKSRFHELGIRRMPRFFFLNLHTDPYPDRKADVVLPGFKWILLAKNNIWQHVGLS